VAFLVGQMMAIYVSAKMESKLFISLSLDRRPPSVGIYTIIL
jgi:hypothetical protein